MRLTQIRRAEHATVTRPRIAPPVAHWQTNPIQDKATDVNATRRDDDVNTEAKDLSHASDDAIDQAVPAKKRRVVIEEEWIYVEGFDPHYPDKARRMGLDMTCRTVADEGCAWAVKRLGEEMEKSLAYYHTGEPIDKICID